MLKFDSNLWWGLDIWINVGSSILRELLEFQFWHQLFFLGFWSVGLHMKTYEKANEHMSFCNYENYKSIKFNSTNLWKELN
jgi:hypothetical protein